MATNDAPTTRNCGAMEIHRRLLTESESYRTSRAQLKTPPSHSRRWAGC